MTPQTKLFTFALPHQLKERLRLIKKRDGISEAEQIRRGLELWFESRGVMNAERKRAATRKRSR